MCDLFGSVDSANSRAVFSETLRREILEFSRRILLSIETRSITSRSSGKLVSTERRFSYEKSEVLFVRRSRDILSKLGSAFLIGPDGHKIELLCVIINTVKRYFRFLFFFFLFEISSILEISLTNRESFIPVRKFYFTVKYRLCSRRQELSVWLESDACLRLQISDKYLS